MTSWSRCLQSSSCPRHTTRFRSTSCIRPSSTLQQDKRCMQLWCRCRQQKNCPRRTLRCPRCCCNLTGSIGRPDKACKQRSHRCLRSSGCPQSTAHSRLTSGSVTSNTPQQGKQGTRLPPWTHCSHCTSQKDTQYNPRSCRCPQSSSCRARTARSRLASCSRQGSTRLQDKRCMQHRCHFQPSRSCPLGIHRCR